MGVYVLGNTQLTRSPGKTQTYPYSYLGSEMKFASSFSHHLHPSKCCSLVYDNFELNKLKS